MNLIYLRGATAPWTPARLFAASEPGAWYDPSDLSTMWKDTAGTDPVTADGDIVARMDDKSGNGCHAIQASLSARPVYHTSGGLHYLEFDKVNDVMEFGSIDRTSWTDGLLVTGHRPLTTSLGPVVDGLDAAPSVNHEPFSDNNWYCSFGGSTRKDTITSLSFDTSYVLTRKYASGDMSFRKNGADVSTATTTSVNFGGTGLITLCESTFRGYVYSVILLGRAATAGEITSAETWVNGKTGAY